MDFITNCFEEYGSAFSGRLKAVGFSDDLAKEFLTEIASDIFYSLQFPQYYGVVANPLADFSLFLMMEIIVC